MGPNHIHNRLVFAARNQLERSALKKTVSKFGSLLPEKRSKRKGHLANSLSNKTIQRMGWRFSLYSYSGFVRPAERCAGNPIESGRAKGLKNNLQLSFQVTAFPLFKRISVY